MYNLAKEYQYLEDVLSAINFERLSCWDYFSQDNFEDVFDCSDLPEGWNYFYGASKLVLVPDHENIVVKIPFEADSGYYNDDDEYCNDPFEGAVYPIEQERGWDYCRSEAEYYKLAEEAGVAMFFAKTVCIGDVYGYPVYVQEKIEIQEDSWHSHSEKQKSDSRDKIDKMGYWVDMNDDFLADLFEWYSDAEVESLMAFLKAHDIQDLRGSNVGYDSCGAPVLSDYSDFDN